MDEKTQKMIDVAAELRGKLAEQGEAEVDLHKTKEFKRWATAYGDVERLKGEFNQLLGEARPVEASPSALMPGKPAEVKPSNGNGASVAQRILRVLEASPGRTFSVGEVADKLGVDAKPVKGNLYRFAAEKKIRRASPGHFRARKTA